MFVKHIVENPKFVPAASDSSALHHSSTWSSIIVLTPWPYPTSPVTSTQKSLWTLFWASWIPK
jgi:hypothetical protein